MHFHSEKTIQHLFQGKQGTKESVFLQEIIPKFIFFVVENTCSIQTYTQYIFSWGNQPYEIISA